MKEKIDTYIGGFLTILMILMTLDVLWGVFTRYVLANQASWSEELARFLLIWIGILGAAYASGQQMHLAIDLLSPKLNERNQKLVKGIIKWLIIGFAFLVLVVGGGRLIYISHTLGQTSPALQLPMSIVYGVLPLSGLLIIYYKLTEKLHINLQ
ncbi:MAG: TRAP transporter small permease [Saprospiraceae bacterium]